MTINNDLKKCYRVNIGCGMSPTEGWLNYDNSFSIKLAKFSHLSNFLFKCGLLNKKQIEYIKFCQFNRIKWADATKRIPLSSNSVSVLYSSHMLEHLDRKEARQFLAEALRVLASGGIIRLALPDLEKIINTYNRNKDADQFLLDSHMCIANETTLFNKLIKALFGSRHHLWMYDGASLSKLLASIGFTGVSLMNSGETHIQDYEPLNLSERDEESFYIEAYKK